MSKYLGPKVRIIRRLGNLPTISIKKRKSFNKTSGEHGKEILLEKTPLSDNYKICLLEKQRLRFTYGITEKQFVLYYNLAKKNSKKLGPLDFFFFKLIETRLDCIIYRLGFASTIATARQVISHKHIFINNKIVNIGSFQCKDKDIIKVKAQKKSKKLIINNLGKTSFRHFFFKSRSKQIDNLLKEKKILNKSIYKSYNLFPKYLKVENFNLLIASIIFPFLIENTLLKLQLSKLKQYIWKKR